ncbi:MAG: hypothetical protein KA233_08535 [Novosphingobium sp.]|jgi:hypothetical protein|nr:hypothetical protein [Novosphingobium sp.]
MAQDEYDPQDAWTDKWLAAVHDYSNFLRDHHETNPWPDRPFLSQSMIYLMTELWDREFSLSEIRAAFAEALAELPHYTQGHESRP